jgi:hypothetical protein
LNYFESTLHGLEILSYEASVDEKFSKYLYSSDENPNKIDQEELLVASRKDISYSAKQQNGIPYYNLGFSSAEIKLENSWKKFWDG